MARRLSAIAAIVFAAIATTLTAPALGAHATAVGARADGGPVSAQPRLAQVMHVLRARHAAVTTYRLRSGDYLAKAAQRFCHDQRDWIGIWHATKPHLANPNMVPVGLTVTIACNHSGAGYYPPVIHRVYASSSVRHYVRGSSRYHRIHRSYSSSRASYGAAGSFERCVIARESGGNSQVMNSSGHYGLYQFSAATWAAYGGSSADFGQASASEQRRVFLNAMARGGQSNWSPYDGCSLW
jgi:hypothetical protein